MQAPLANAFSPGSAGESVLKTQEVGEGDLRDLIEEFSDGRIQFAFVKVKDPNSGLPKNVLIAWCGQGVPERTKGYFTSHLNAVSKVLHGYHVQITARSDSDLTPETIMQKVADSSGSKYSGSTSTPSAGSGGPPPPVASKPVMPTKSFGGSSGSFQPLGARSRQSPAASGTTDNDGWGEDAPQPTRNQLEKVESAYKPTKVDMNALQSNREPSRYQAPAREENGNPDVVKGGYQPIGKVDIAAIRQQAQASGSMKDDRPTVVKGSYEPVGKVDIAEIRRKAQAAPPPAAQPTPPAPAADDDRPKSLAERSAAFQSSSSGGRLTEMPKPQISNRFSQASSFAGTKAPTPGGFEAKAPAPAAPVGTASRTFADQGGKTPAQQWEERRRARGLSGAADTSAPGAGPTSPIKSQASGGWQSTYEGKKWDVQIPNRTGGSGVSAQRTGDATVPPAQQEPDQDDAPPSGGIGSIRDRFAGAAAMGAPAPASFGAPEPPPLDTSSKPNAGARGVPIPGLPTQPSEAGRPAEEHTDLPPPPPQPMPADEPEEDEPEPQGSPVRIAMPVARGAEPEELEKPEQLPPRAVPGDSLAKVASQHAEPEREPEDDGRGAAQAAAASTFGAGDAKAAEQGGKEAVAQYDYEKAEDNELELHEGERITGIDMVDEDWWMGTNSRGETGLFPSNYVELIEGGGSGGGGAAAAAPPAPEPEPEPAATPATTAGGGSGAGGKTATAQYDYEAAEDNELSFPDGAKITDIVSRPFLLLDLGVLMLICFFRSSPTRIGGWAPMAARRDCSLRTTSSWITRLDGRLGDGQSPDTCAGWWMAGWKGMYTQQRQFESWRESLKRTPMSMNVSTGASSTLYSKDGMLCSAPVARCVVG